MAEDFESQDGESDAPSEAHTVTPVTTAHSTTTAASRRFPSDLKTIPCTWPNCEKTFNRPARLTAHLRSHTNDRPFKCPNCAKTYLEEKHLRQHIKGSHSHERQYVCEACDKAFLTATRLRRHAAVHEGQERFRCRGYDDNCTRTFRKHQTLQRHIRVDHLQQPAFVCGNTSGPPGGAASGAAGAAAPAGTPCTASFDTAGALRRHVEREHSAPKFWCDECSTASTAPTVAPPPSSILLSTTGFATRALLEAHVRHQHANCPFCDVRCVGGPAELHRHIDMHHSGKSAADRKTIVCPHEGCDKAFTRRANLNVHVRAVHEGLRFVCGGSLDAEGKITGVIEDRVSDDTELAAWDARTRGCGRRFVSKMKLEEHIRYVHLGHERPVATLIVSVNKSLDGVGEAGAVDNTADASLLATAFGAAAAAAATTVDEPPSADMLIDALLGTNRTVVCTVAGCSARFVRHHDRNVHVAQDHAGGAEALADAGVADAGVADGGLDDDMFNMFISNDVYLNADDAQCQIDEAEMQQLIGGDEERSGGKGELAAVDNLDPDLFV